MPGRVWTMFWLLMPALAVAGDCPPTPQMFMGTHYRPATGPRINVGRGVVVHGRVLEAGGCVPLAGARIEHWQAGTDGFYRDDLRAWLTADDKGAYRFETEWPGAPVPHIHFIVSADGYRRLATQWVGDAPVKEIELDLVLEPETAGKGP